MFESAGVLGRDAVELPVVRPDGIHKDFTCDRTHPLRPANMILFQQINTPAERMVHAAANHLFPSGRTREIFLIFCRAFSHVVQQAGQISRVPQADPFQLFGGIICHMEGMLGHGLLQSFAIDFCDMGQMRFHRFLPFHPAS